MKHPKRLDFSRPQMWWQGFGDENFYGRIRIFYPSGSSDWLNGHLITGSQHVSWYKGCCFAKFSSSSRNTYKAMLRYDKGCEYPPAEFLGYL